MTRRWFGYPETDPEKIRRLIVLSEVKAAQRRRAEPDPSGHWCLYKLYDKDDRLLYIGITSDIVRRFRQHSQEKEWWWDVADIEVVRFLTRQAARTEEHLLIMMLHPVHNYQDNFIRQRDPAVEPVRRFPV